ncbi:MAG: BREX-1 system adenine-specific DNA-methyltransferase PglX [Bacteroidota bacterium]
MNTNSLKKFAQQARKKLLEQITAKMEQVLNTDSAELREKAGHVKKLQQAIVNISKEQVIDKVAYTWFNRLMALRFMDANDYQPIRMRVVTPKDGYTMPEILDEAKQGHIPDGLPVKPQHIYDLLDGKIPSTNAQNEAYKELLIGACNHLHETFPFLFERINDYAELLLPDDLTSEFSIVQDVRDGMTTEDCQAVEIIGWLYQFYISEKKDEVFAAKGKVKKEDIPAATQLFTPRWIVEYMVQNTLGKLWLQNKPKSRLREHMPYFIESPSMESDDYLRVSSVEEITLLDQACGSGHILVYAFELFTKIYEEEGYSPSEIPKLIIEKNLFGFEIDERAAQLAGFAQLMKAKGSYRRLFRKEVPKPNILRFENIEFDDGELEDYLERMKLDMFSQDLQADLKQFEQATNYGSLMQVRTQDLPHVQRELPTPDIFLSETHHKVLSAFRQMEMLSMKFHCVVDNPPYMGSGKMNAVLSDFVKSYYPDSKADLMVCFMEAGIKVLQKNGFLGMVNRQAWMFLSSYESLRKSLLESNLIDTLVQVGYNSFPELNSKIVQAVSFVIKKETTQKDGVYFNLNDVAQSANKKLIFEKKLKNDGKYLTNQNDFGKIHGSPIGYWLSKQVFKLFQEGALLSITNPCKKGMDTANNLKYLRFWNEVKLKNTELEHLDSNKNKTEFQYWIPYQKGGAFRRWFGNLEYVINWKEEGRDIANEKGTLRNTQYYFKKSLTWTEVSSGKFNIRYVSNKSIFDATGPSIFGSKLEFLLGLLNTKIYDFILGITSPTIHYNVGAVANLPVIWQEDEQKIELVEKSIEISKSEWDSRETSWDFLQNELLRHNAQDLEESYDLYCQYWKNKFHQLHHNEEELNRQFIEIYGLQDELTPDVPLEDITILKDETKIENGELVFQPKEIMAQFVSYAVGCMFGRYSLDKEGLILANEGETLQDYLAKIGKEEAEASFLPDDDNIIPVLDDEWFEDDITGRFYEFLKATFGKADFDKILAFVEDCLGKDIRKYFVKDFYKDHIKRYKKRPIYWLFSSPQGSFNVLIYLHRYTPDTLNQILNGYLKEYREKLNTRIEHLNHLIETGNSTEQNKAAKEKDRINVVLLELQEYERDILYPLATERIPLDLDDGVLVNYNKFGKAIKEVRGLNDKKTKEKVRGFDWIDGKLIK